MDNSQVCIQFTGGKDSTLLAAMMAQEFDKVHLVSFKNSLISDFEKLPVNIGKLQKMFGKSKFSHRIIDNEGLLKHIYTGNWFQDLRRYKTYAANNICGPCRLSMVSQTIVYCLQNEIHFVRDGANRTGFDLSQQVWALDILKHFYQEYGIDYDSPLHDRSRNDIELLKYGLSAKNPMLLYRSQPLCRGGGEVHNIYFRCYFLPSYGRNARLKLDLEWLQEKLNVCRDYIARNTSPALPD